MDTNPAIIARALRHRYPDIYRELELDCSTPPFTEGDINNLWDICEIDPDRTKVVIVAALLLYSPQTITIGIKAKKGLIAAIAKCKGSTQPATSMHVPSAIDWYRLYPSFKSKVDQIIEEFKKEKV